MNHEETEKLIVRLFDKKFVSAVRVTQFTMSVGSGMREMPMYPETTVEFQALLVEGGRVTGSLKLQSLSIDTSLRAEEQIKRIKEIKKKKEENLVNFMDELRSVEDE